MPPFCRRTVPSDPSIGGAQNGIFWRTGYFWRMHGEALQSRAAGPGYESDGSGLRNHPARHRPGKAPRSSRIGVPRIAAAALSNADDRMVAERDACCTGQARRCRTDVGDASRAL